MTHAFKRIMCIDDENDILEVAKFALADMGGFEVTICKGGKAALECVATVCPDIILLDVMMPEMDGPTTLKTLRQNPALNNIPIVFMTARMQPAEIEQYLQIGAAGVIAKPFDPMTLSEQVRAIYERFHAQ